MHTITINVKDNVLDKVLYLLKNLSDIEIVENKDKDIKISQKDNDDERWVYWEDAELDNFGKIAIGLSHNNYDDEDYSKW